MRRALRGQPRGGAGARPRQRRASFRQRLGLAADAPTLALLPGSRTSEIRRLLPDHGGRGKQLAAERPELQIVVPVAPHRSRREEIVSRFEGSGAVPRLVDGRAPEVVGASDAAIVASGTAALEAGLMLRPLVVVYRVSLLTYCVGRLMLKVAHVALVNLLAGPAAGAGAAPGRHDARADRRARSAACGCRARRARRCSRVWREVRGRLGEARRRRAGRGGRAGAAALARAKV